MSESRPFVDHSLEVKQAAGKRGRAKALEAHARGEWRHGPRRQTDSDSAPYVGREENREIMASLALRSVKPTEYEMAVIERAAARYGLTDPTPDDVLSNEFGERWDAVRGAVFTIVSAMGERGRARPGRRT